MIAYRLHFEESNLRAVDLVHSAASSASRASSTGAFTMQVAEKNVRLNPRQEAAGRSTTSASTASTPRATCSATSRPKSSAWPAQASDPRFAGVDEQLGAVLRFPGDRAGELRRQLRRRSADGPYQIIGTKGSLRARSRPTNIAASVAQELTIGGKTKRKKFKACDQIALEIAYFSGLHPRRARSRSRRALKGSPTCASSARSIAASTRAIRSSWSRSTSRSGPPSEKRTDQEEAARQRTTPRRR